MPYLPLSDAVFLARARVPHTLRMLIFLQMCHTCYSVLQRVAACYDGMHPVYAYSHTHIPFPHIFQPDSPHPAIYIYVYNMYFVRGINRENLSPSNNNSSLDGVLEDDDDRVAAKEHFAGIVSEISALYLFVYMRHDQFI